MADKSPLKATYSGSDTNGLAEFASGDTVAIADGGTGAITASAARTALGVSPTAGSSSLTTLGTIATGTWEATDIAVAHGGTGASTASQARTNLGITDTTPDGSNTEIQYNNSGAFGGSANLIFDGTKLSVVNGSPATYANGDAALVVGTGGTSGTAVSEIVIAADDGSQSELNFTNTADHTNQASIYYGHGTTQLNYESLGGHYFTLSGTEHMRIQADKVSMGTTTTYNADYDDLQVAGSGNVGITIATTTTTGTTGIAFADGTGSGDNTRGGIVYDHNASLLKLNSNNGFPVVIDGSGRVGINNDSPSAKLEIEDNLSSSQLDAIRINNVSTQGYGSQMTFRQGTTVVGMIKADNQTSDTWAMRLGTYTKETLLTINENGYVGIGQTVPSYPLEISASDGVSLAWQRTGGSAKKWGFVSDNGASYFRNITDTVDAIVVTNAGNVGIGTASASVPLAIVNDSAASINIEQYTSNANGPTLRLDKGRGTAGSPSLVAGDDALGNIWFSGWSSSGQRLNGASIRAFASQNWSVNNGGAYMQFGTAANNATSPTVAMTITSGGSVQIGGTSYPTAKLSTEGGTSGSNDVIFRNNSSPNPYGPWIYFQGASPDNNSSYFIAGTDSTTTRFRIYSDGDMQNHDGTYGTLSDVRDKQDIVDARSYWSDFKALQYRKFRRKSDVAVNADAPHRLGLIAQEVEEVFPLLAPESPDSSEEGSPTHKWVKSSIIEGPIMARVVQELQTRLESAEAKIAALETA